MCKKCDFSSGGKPNPCSDMCDGCQSDPDTGWGGFTDNSDPKNHRKPKKSEDVHYIDHDNAVTITPPDMCFMFGDVRVVLDGVKQITTEELASKLWTLSTQIENYIKDFSCVLKNKSGQITGIKYDK